MTANTYRSLSASGSQAVKCELMRKTGQGCQTEKAAPSSNLIKPLVSQDLKCVKENEND